jgi:hypothetical protein
MRAEIEGAKDALLARLDEQSSSLRAIEHRQPRQGGIDYDEARKAYLSSLQTVPVQINQFVQGIERVAASHCILRSLSDATIGSREGQIHQAYGNTFGWIFDSDGDDKNHQDVDAARTRFEKWLSSSSEVFWINGKAGSGKSTLMKYLADHRKTRKILRQWAGDENLVIAIHFFWNSGLQIQKSYIGLMQNLLYQILQTCPELISFASPRRWKADENSVTHRESWTRTELATALENIMGQNQLRSRFCFFIDGLDEYADEEVGEHHELIRYLDLLAQSTQVKLCVSSRPWTVFKDRYEQRKDLTFVLQELTSKDMYGYVERILNDDERFRHLAEREPQALELAFQIREKAEGVFLWVYLVVRSLLRGLSQHDDTLELERRLSAIPNDLNQYFLKIFANIEPVYQQEAMRAFQLATVAMPLPLLAFKYISKEVVNPRFAIEMMTREPNVSDDKARDNVNKWCRDLLEFKVDKSHPRQILEGPQEGKVHFLHRTVKDFLLAREMQMHFNKQSVCASSPRQAMCMVYLADLKSKSHPSDRMKRLSESSDGSSLMHWATICEQTESKTPMEILDEYGRLINLGDVGVRTPYMTIDGKSRPVNVVQYAVRRGLNLYVSHCLDRDTRAKDNILWYALPMNTSVSPHDTTLITAMIDLLLEKGADPNQLCVPDARGNSGSRKTTWEYFLETCYSDSDGWIPKFAKPLIIHGADLDVKIRLESSRFTRGLDVRTCLLTKKGYWPGVEKAECERQVDEWLAEGRARRTASLPTTSSQLSIESRGPPSKPSRPSSLRARFKRLLA